MCSFYTCYILMTKCSCAHWSCLHSSEISPTRPLWVRCLATVAAKYLQLNKHWLWSLLDLNIWVRERQREPTPFRFTPTRTHTYTETHTWLAPELAHMLQVDTSRCPDTPLQRSGPAYWPGRPEPWDTDAAQTASPGWCPGFQTAA